MDQIFEKAKDLHVVATKIYLKDNETYAYKDNAKTKKFDKDELTEAFIKGCLIVTEDGYVRPYQVEDKTTYAQVCYIAPNGTTATSADIKTVRSE